MNHIIVNCMADKDVKFTKCNVIEDRDRLKGEGNHL